MLVCKNCNIEYEEGRKFCKHCGDPLAPKLEPISTQKKVNRVEEEISDGKLICPNCKIIYEFGSSCIQCGSALGREIPRTAKEEPETARRTESEEEPPPVTSQEKEIAAPRTQLICPTCKMIYEHGDSCIKCESALIPQIPSQAMEEPKTSRTSEVEEKPFQVQTNQEQLIEAPRKKLICPTCKIIYERGSSCVRCGSSLVLQGSTQDKEKPKSSDTEVSPSTSPPKASEHISDLDLDQDLVVAPKQPPLSGLKGQELGAIQRVNRKEIETSLEEELFRDQSPEQQLNRKTSDHVEKRVTSLKRRERDYRRLFLEVGGITIMVLAGGYFLWSVYSHIITKEPEPKAPTSKGAVNQILPSSSSSTNPATTGRESGELKNKEESASISKEGIPVPLSLPDTPKTPSTGIQEMRNIKTLLENIRQANLQKDIDLFISCYASDFENLQGRKRATLAYWERFNYLDLSYDLKDSSISVETAKARVEWLIKTSSKGGGRPQQNKSILDVTFKKEGGGWKIKEVKQAR
jgi:uncharacterized protein YbaR (Trm112 family)